MLVAHITFAFISLLLGTYIVFVPSRQKLYLSYVFATGAVVSGSLLAIMQPVNVGKACISGIVYLVCITTLSMIVRKRLAL